MALAHRYCTLDLIMLHVLPYPLVRVEFWGVRRQDEQSESPLGGFLVLLDDVRGVDRAAVDDEEDRGRAVAQELLAELDETGGFHAGVEHVEVQLPVRVDRRDHVDRFLLSGREDDRGAPDRSPGPTRVVVGADPGLVSEEDARTLLGGLLGDRRVGLLLPGPDFFWILLVGPIARALGRHTLG